MLGYMVTPNYTADEPIIITHGPHALWVIDDVGALATMPELEPALQRLFSQLCKTLWGKVSRSLVVELSLVEDAAIQALNRQHRGKDNATDVLTFPQFETLAAVETALPPAPESVVLGNSVLSVPYARANATTEPRVAAYPSPVLAYITDRVCHSALHLSGRHHATMPDYDAVVAFQDEMLSHVLGNACE